MSKRYEVYESLKRPGTFNVFDVSKGRFVHRYLPKDSAEEQAGKLNALVPPKVACRLCGCTWSNACHDEQRGACSWTDKMLPLCSHCQDSASLVIELLTGATPEGEPSDRVESLSPDTILGEITIPVHHAEQLVKILQHRLGETS